MKPAGPVALSAPSTSTAETRWSSLFEKRERRRQGLGLVVFGLAYVVILALVLAPQLFRAGG